MAQRDLNFYKFLMEAFNYKVFVKNEAPDYKGFGFFLPYNDDRQVQGIFHRARRLLPSVYNSSFPDDDQGNLAMARQVLDNLRYKRDAELAKYFDITSAPQESEKFHQQLKLASDNYTKAHPQPAAEAPSPVTTAVRATHLPSAPAKSEKTVEEKPVETTEPPKATQPTQAPRLNPAGFRLPSSVTSALSNLGSRMGRLFQGTIGKRLGATAIASSIGGLAGSVFGPWGAGGGAGLGGLLANSSTARQAVSDLGRGALNQLSSVRRMSPPQSPSFMKKVWQKRIWLVLILLILGSGFLVSLGGGGPGSGGSVASCKFSRGNQTNMTVKSHQLQAIFQEVSAKSGIPTAVLASVAIHESSFTSTANNNHDAFSNIGFSGSDCEPHFQTSSTGALGLMQVQPPKNIHDQITSKPVPPFESVGAFSETGVRLGAEMADRPYDSLTMSDFCNIRTSVYLGAGVLLAKNNNQPPTSPEAVEKAVCGYFGGSCTYESGGKPYNYGQEARADFLSCSSSSSSAGPVPQAKLDKILYWAGLINNALEHGNPIESWNRMVQNITNGIYSATTRTAQNRGVGPTGIYWCTNIVIDSYNLSDIPGLGPGHQLVRNMLNFWQSTPGYSYIPYDGINSLNQVRPGYVVFRIVQNDFNFDHASIIQSISVDQRGDGSIKTLDSNSFKNWSSAIKDGRIVKDPFDWPIVGFGGIQ